MIRAKFRKTKDTYYLVGHRFMQKLEALKLHESYYYNLGIFVLDSFYNTNIIDLMKDKILEFP